MGRRLILDTGILIASERGRSAAIAAFAETDDIAIAAVTAAELTHGVLRSTGERQRKRREYVEAVLNTIPVESYDLNVARHHAELLAAVHQQGRPRGAHDLITAATARASGRTLVTTDERARFAQLPGVKVLLVDA